MLFATRWGSSIISNEFQYQLITLKNSKQHNYSENYVLDEYNFTFCQKGCDGLVVV